MTQIALIEITRNGGYVAVSVHGQYRFLANLGNPELAETVVTVAEKLALIHDAELKRLDHTAHTEWRWAEIQKEFLARSERKPGLPQAISVLQIAFSPESFSYLNDQHQADNEPLLTTAQIRAGCEKAQQAFLLNPRDAIERCYETVLEIFENFILAEG